MTDFNKMPVSQACRLIDFENARIVPGIVNGTFFLVVSGQKPYMNMEVSLRPRFYPTQPEYWGIEVVGCLPGVGLPALAPYTVSIEVTGIMGTKGVEVIGATRSQKLDRP